MKKQFYSFIFFLMNHLAMDVDKDKIIFFSDILGKHFNVKNNFHDIEQFLRTEQFNPSDTIVGCEATGDYHREACLAFLQNNYTVKVINPILTKQFTNCTIRKKKTDFIDAEIIAKLLKDNQGNCISIESLDQKKKTSLRTDRALVKCSSDLKRVLKSLKLKAKTMDVQNNINIIEESIEFLGKKSKELLDQALENPTEQEKIIDSVPGCGLKLSAIISSEAGDIKRFPSAKQFKAYVGIDPKVSQSGNSIHHGKMTKRGNPYLRYALFLAAGVARIHDPELKAFYDKKRAEGKSHRHATCVILRKLCERIYAIVSKNCLYEIKSLKIE